MNNQTKKELRNVLEELRLINDKIQESNLRWKIDDFIKEIRGKIRGK